MLNTDARNIIAYDKGKDAVILLRVTCQKEKTIEKQMQMLDYM